jgi:diguanylate cyclase (GGDEF)-like protein
MDPQRELFERAPVGLVTVDRRLRVRRANALGRDLLIALQRRGRLQGRRLLDGVEPELAKRLAEELLQLPRGTQRLCSELVWPAQEGGGQTRVLQVQAQAPVRADELMLALVDVTAIREEARRAHEAAQTDPLTGLLNRAGGELRLHQALESARPPGSQCVLVALDLDGFKQVNDRWGHAAGDALLRVVGQRLRRQVCQRGWAVRQGGDEFLLLLPNVPPDFDVPHWLEQVLTDLRVAVPWGRHRLKPAASAGYGRYPAQAHDAPSLLRRADAALYRAKRAGKGRASD